MEYHTSENSFISLSDILEAHARSFERVNEYEGTIETGLGTLYEQYEVRDSSLTEQLREYTNTIEQLSGERKQQKMDEMLYNTKVRVTKQYGTEREKQVAAANLIKKFLEEERYDEAIEFVSEQEL